MNVTIDLHTAFQVAVGLAVVFLLYFAWTISKLVNQLLAFKAGLIAHAKAVPTKKDVAKLIPTWLDKYETLPDCPKREAYLERLVTAGVLDKDGNRLKPDEG